MVHTRLRALALAAVFVAGVPAHAVQFENRSFEQGSLNGWEYIGDTSVQNAAALGVTPDHSPRAALLTTTNLSDFYTGHYGSTFGVDVVDFLAWLGPGFIPRAGDFFGIEGHSGLRQSVDLRAGDVVSFDWNLFGDGVGDLTFDQAFAWFYPSSDPSSGGMYARLTSPFIHPNTMTPWLGKCREPPDLPPGYDSDPLCAYSTGWQSYSLVAPAQGNYTLVFGVFNREDPAYLSALWLDNFKISRVPEPATLALFGIGLTGLAFTRRRKQ